MTPRRIHWNRFDGKKLPDNARLITRPSKFGNPFKECPHRSRDAAVAQFTEFLHTRSVDPSWLCCDRAATLHRAERYPTTERIRADLASRDLACAWGPGESCHGDPLISVSNDLPLTIGGAR